jgi:adenylate cyclase
LATPASKWRPTLGQVFVASLLGLALVLALLFALVFRGLQATIIESSERTRDQASREISERVTNFLNLAPATVREFQAAVSQGVFDPRNSSALETALFSILVSSPSVSELTLTYGVEEGFDADGRILLAEEGRGQWTVARAPAPAAGGSERLGSRHVRKQGDGYTVAIHALGAFGDAIAEMPGMSKDRPLEDPTIHPTFVTPAKKEFFGRMLWSDLHWSQLDAGLPRKERRVEVSVQQGVNDAAGKFLGVLRVGLLAGQLDTAVRIKLTPAGQEDPHRIFICDVEGRLVTRLMPSDVLDEYDDDLRVSCSEMPGEVAVALGHAMLKEVGETQGVISREIQYEGKEYLVTFRALMGTQDWIIGIVVPRSHYLGGLLALRDRLLLASLVIMLALLAGGLVVLQAVKRGQGQIARESEKMNAFEFAPAPTKSVFRDVSEVLESFEKAKNAMRAMGKYVPLDLVRKLFREKSEPVLGGELTEISIMFTDIKDFTSASEKLTPNELADALGRYLEVMAGIIHRDFRGTIDKYIGDAIMTIWNAPEREPDHARLACLAALHCRDAAMALSRSDGWRGLPPFETRFGLHRDTAMVGHFGSPDRLSYTAIGDAVNLASRLEGLNKQYGTAILVSESIREAAGDFEYRLLDWVAVKGKSNAIKIYELLAQRDGSDDSPRAFVKRYEQAFAAYAGRDFAGALRLLETQPDDPPSVVLGERCREFLAEPPPAGWAGVYVSMSK